MDFEEVLMKKTGFCRCCLDEGCFKDMQLSYLFNDQIEVYDAMLSDSLNIYISQHVEGPNGPTRLICEVCITRLRDACNFKKQVLDCEKRFIDMLHRGEFRNKDDVIKTETLDELENRSAPADSDISDDDTKPLTTLRSRQSVGRRRDAAPCADNVTSPVKKRRGRPRKNTDLTKILHGKTNGTRKYYKDTPTRRRQHNLETLFNNTTIIPFKWRGKYMCFYCGKSIEEYTSLRKHTMSHGNCNATDYAIKLVRSVDIETKIDVSEIACEVCNESFQDVREIAVHLNFKHGLKYDLDVDMSFTMYRLVDLTCLQCGESVDSFRDLVRHVNRTHPVNSHVCDRCPKEFSKKKDLAVHVKSFHKAGGYDCEECDANFESSTKLRNHKDGCHAHTCDVCFESFPTKEKRRSHMNETHIKDGVTQCVFCKLPCNTRQSYWQHLRKCKAGKEALLNTKPKKTKLEARYSEVKTIRTNVACLVNLSNAMPFKFYLNNFRCFYCPTNFADSEELRKHTSTEHPVCDVKHKSMRMRDREDVDVKLDIANLTCKMCQLSLLNLDSLIDHLVSKHEVKYDKRIRIKLVPFKLQRNNYPCLLCEEKQDFEFFGNLLKHVNEAHSDNKVICPFCGESFRSKNNMRPHIRKHHAPPKLPCQECDLAFHSTARLASHLSTAHGQKVYKCNKCPELFFTPYLKRRHMICDHDVGSKCRYCGKMFTGNAIMKSHVRRTHLKEKTVECPICHMKMFDVHMMKVHMVRHDGERNFHCDICGKKFLWKKNLRNHLSVHDSGKASGVVAM